MWGPNHCDLSWKIPDSDGGAPITDYEIEYMVRTKIFDVRFNQAKCQTILKSIKLRPYLNFCDDRKKVWECGKRV